MLSRYDSEYDNYRGGHMTSDAESDFPNEDIDSDVGAVLDELSLENIRQISKNITKKFGARSDKDEDSEEWGGAEHNEWLSCRNHFQTGCFYNRFPVSQSVNWTEWLDEINTSNLFNTNV